MPQAVTVSLNLVAYDRLEALQKAMGQSLGLRKVTQAAAIEAILLEANAAWWAEHYGDFAKGLAEAAAQGEAPEPPAEADPDAAPRSVPETPAARPETVTK